VTPLGLERLPRIFVLLAMIFVGGVGCYGRAGPTVGYTFGRGLSLGAEASAGALAIGPRGGFVSRPRSEAEAQGPENEEPDEVPSHNEAVSFGSVDLGLLGLGSLSLGASRVDDEDLGFMAGLDIHPGVIYGAATGTGDPNDNSPFGIEIVKSVHAFLYVGVRYVGGEYEIYASPQILGLSACTNACR
jgi:hypothetical protein